MIKLRSYYKKNQYEAGCDEAGRGCLAGPVIAAAVILDPSKPIRNLQDSKKLSENQRLKLRDEIFEKALAWSIQAQSPSEIDKYNILQASLRAMALCVQKLTMVPALILVDGNKQIPIAHIPQLAIVKGDGKYQCIAAASILAKTHRDELMLELHQEFEGYGWRENKGYPTIFHREAIKTLGLSPHHRRSFKCFDLNPQKLLFP
ncbi:MAG: ribonuclease HII [Saprospiraceae bacterium]|nr:ribonuclease HII [Saprospiraceae bacterium]MBK7810956.1 ribonuclease HII [Saprospiraceae bacterium]MBK9630560.1 ribonuclease HII [Saprospiraceae bacterium]